MGFVHHKVWCHRKSCVGECSGTRCSNCETLEQERDALRAEVERLKVWSSDSHVTDLEAEVSKFRAESESWMELTLEANRRIAGLRAALEDLLLHTAPKFAETWAEYNREFEAAKDRAKKALGKQ